jgi:hypothetical protein
VVQAAVNQLLVQIAKWHFKNAPAGAETPHCEIAIRRGFWPFSEGGGSNPFLDRSSELIYNQLWALKAVVTTPRRNFVAADR